ncbi:unnamed protein product [Meganyctiphanes norvegica]|uniref:PiggyBac transposable element-derived protein domain-containing protein n=1 Tax=Meganyctiphanes norvegica TaxID=48144 RepID=A0AAV2S8K4_MEGNR
MGVDISAESYTKLTKRMIWKEIEATDDSSRAIPIWSQAEPFTGRVLSPIDYFRRFIDYEVLQYICNESNRFALQKDIANKLCLEVGELETWIGICLYMSLVKLPRNRYYWDTEVEATAVMDYMRVRRWEQIKHYIHFSDDKEAVAKGQPGYDPISKIRPLIDLLNNKFNAITMTENVSIAEQMIPYYGTKGPRTYVKGNQNPWGFRVWALADNHGVIYNIELCTKATPVQDGHPDIKSKGNLVLKLAKIIPHHANFKLYMDNYFSDIPLYLELLKLGIHCIGTVRLDKISGIKKHLITDAALKHKGNSSFVEYEGKLDEGSTDTVRVVRWNDDKIFNLMTTFGSAMPLSTCQRWNSSEDNYLKATVQCPSIVSLYNSNMGGVDKMDSLLGFYRMFSRSKKWYHRIFFHCVDMSLINGWLLYKRDFESTETQGTPISLHEFKSNVSYTLRNQKRPLKKVESPSAVAKEVRLFSRSKRKLPPTPVIDDQVGHFPVALKKRGRCRNTPCKGSVVYYCMKCEVHLCIGSTQDRQCFLQFHKVAYDMTKLPHK